VLRITKSRVKSGYLVRQRECRHVQDCNDQSGYRAVPVQPVQVSALAAQFEIDNFYFAVALRPDVRLSSVWTQRA
jgi:hypothetical protein